MSYCRWSTDDFQCDIYCYESCDGGFDIHVAARRPVLDGTQPAFVSYSPERAAEWIARQMAFSKWLDSAQHVEIGLTCDGKSFNEPTAEDAAQRLLMLRECGYNVPQDAIDALQEEARD